MLDGGYTQFSFLDTDTTKYFSPNRYYLSVSIQSNFFGQVFLKAKFTIKIACICYYL